MNRIILIGNGFDVAHGLDTKYSDFLEDYWKVVIEDINRDDYEPSNNSDISVIRKPSNYKFSTIFKEFADEINQFKENKVRLSFKNKFLGYISNNQSLNNWVDIEAEYYKLLVKAYKKELINGIHYKVEDLNKDFKKIVYLLKEYLFNIQENFFASTNSSIDIEKIKEKVYANYSIRDLTEIFSNEVINLEYEKFLKLKEQINLNKKEDLNEKEEYLISRVGIYNSKEKIKYLLNMSNISTICFDLLPENILFLNFNYTATQTLYKEAPSIFKNNQITKTNVEIIHIHGSLNEEDNNPIIFGYGDELDDNYPAIEKLDDNEYLENIKSIKYSETDNYKRLLEYINSEPYQVFIFGHSCGLSDRTLLNTLFEHENCVSIKPYYHQWKDDKDETIKDNYSDIVRNISRNFNDKASMRDKVVNKTYCEPLLPIA